MAKHTSILVVLLLTATWLVVAGCVDPLEIPEAGPCDGNRSPHVGNISFVVDHHDDDEGFLIAEPPVEDSTVFVSKFDTIVVWFEFRDKDCNLSGGDIYWKLDADRFAPVEKIVLTERQACDGINVEPFLGTMVDFELPRGYGYLIPAEKLEALSCELHEFQIGVTDACGRASEETISGDFFIRKIDCR